MKLFEAFSQKGFHTSIVTSFGIDFGVYENIMLSRLRGAGCTNNLLIVDQGMLGLALEGASEPPRFAGRTYTVTPAVSRGVFHPKVFLQFGQKTARLIVGSANVTSPGLAGNLEVAGLLESDDPRSAEARIIAAAWVFLSSFLDPKLESIRRQVEWMKARTPWLRQVEVTTGAIELSDGRPSAFLGSDAPTGIGQRFLDVVGNEKVRRLVVISPYWDDDLAALNRLIGSLQPLKTCVLLERERHVFAPERIAPRHRKRVDLIDFRPKDGPRFVHAKVVIAETNRADHVLYGSANSTVAALGTDRFRGHNAEACLYRSLKPGTAVEALDLVDVLKTIPIAHNDFKPVEAPPDIPRDDIIGRLPGQFTCLFETLLWIPPSGGDSGQDRIELSNDNDEPLAMALETIHDDRGDGNIRFRLQGKERPAFARVRHRDSTLSSPAIVVILDELKDALKDARTKKLDDALARLDTSSDVSLILLETINEFEAAELALLGAKKSSTKVQKTAKAQTSAEKDAIRHLSYDEFMAGRQPRSEGEKIERNSLSGSNLSYIQSFLNRLLSIGTMVPSVDPETNDDNASRAFDSSDETADASAALEEGRDFVTPVSNDQATPPNQRDDAARARIQRHTSREQLCDAVDDLNKMITEKARGGGLRSIDLLRLRAMLTIVATASWNGTAVKRDSMQVLPPTGSPSWPLLIGRILFSYFGGPFAAIRTLEIDGLYDQIPDDFLECWACCMWMIQAASSAAVTHKDTLILKHLLIVRDTIYRVVALRLEEMEDPRVLRMFEALNRRFKVTLALDPDMLSAAHAHTALKVSKPWA